MTSLSSNIVFTKFDEDFLVRLPEYRASFNTGDLLDEDLLFL